MKKITCVLVFVLLLQSCEWLGMGLVQDDELVGTWKVVQTFPDIRTISGDDLDEYLIKEYGYSDVDASNKADQLSDKYFDEVSGTIVFNSDNTYSSTLNFDLLPEEGSWRMASENALNFNGGNTETDILRLNKEVFELRFKGQEFDLDVDNNGSEETEAVCHMELTFNK